jgi:hypothetical protein
MSKLKIYKRLPKSDSERVVRKIRNSERTIQRIETGKKNPKVIHFEGKSITSRRERIAIFKKLRKTQRLLKIRRSKFKFNYSLLKLTFHHFHL